MWKNFTWIYKIFFLMYLPLGRGKLFPFYVYCSSLGSFLCYAIPGGSDSKESICNAGDLGSVSGLGRYPGAGHGNPLQYSCLENPHGQRSLAGYNLCGVTKN